MLGDEQSKDAFDEISKLLADFFQVWPLLIFQLQANIMHLMIDFRKIWIEKIDIHLNSFEKILCTFISL